MKNYIDKLHITSISLMSSPGCNLECKYCHLADQAKQTDNKKLWNDTILAIQDGSYLQNTLSALKRLKQPIERIDHLEFWGQEPTLSMPYLTEKIEDWLDALYAVDSIFFSTNGMSDSDIIYNFIVKIDEVAKKPFRLSFQLSYDGEYGENNIRGGNSQFILENFKKLFQKLNTYRFKNITKVVAITHAVCSTELIEYLDSLEKVEEYIKEHNDFYQELEHYVLNKQVEILPPSFAYQNGTVASVQDGINLNTFCTYMNAVRVAGKYPDMFDYSQENTDVAFSMGGFAGEDIVQKMKETNSTDLGQFVSEYFLNENHPEHFRVLDGCSSSLTDLKLMYDGQILICQNSTFDVNLKLKDLDSDILSQGRYHFVNHHQTCNLVTGTDEELEQYFTHILMSRDPANFKMLYSNVFNLMVMLSEAGQIDASYYKNLRKIQRHAYIMAKICWCYYNVYVLTGTKYTRHLGEIRQMANGMLDRLENMILQKL